LRIPDDALSRFHCALLRTPGGIWVVDLLSREGSRVDGARVRFAKLEDGAALHVGRYRMTLRILGTSAGGGDSSAMRLARLPADQLPIVSRRGHSPARAIEHPIVERPPSPGSLSELEPFLGRLEQVQQQMFEQFHQAMLTMFQTFGAMHRDQIAEVRAELDRIGDLSRELQSLQQAERAAAPDPDPSSGPGSPPESSEPPPGDRQDGPPEPPRDPNLGAVGRDLHDVICRRITSLQAERQSRWKRILDLLSRGSEP
jgi:hypothetical protein